MVYPQELVACPDGYEATLRLNQAGTEDRQYVDEDFYKVQRLDPRECPVDQKPSNACFVERLQCRYLEDLPDSSAEIEGIPVAQDIRIALVEDMGDS